jgi:hypothetical protein
MQSRAPQHARVGGGGTIVYSTASPIVSSSFANTSIQASPPVSLPSARTPGASSRAGT